MFKFFFWISYISIALFVHADSTFTPCSKYGIIPNQPNTTCLDELMKQAHIPGLSVQVIKGEQLLYSYQSGYATLNSRGEGNQIITRDSIFNWCSITKTVCAIAVMQLVEIGALDLDTDINKYIIENNFMPIHNPYYAEDIITLRHLLTHTSSIGSSGVLNYFQVPYDNFNQISLGENFLENYLQTNGDYYINENWLNYSIGSYYSYSNVGIGLAAWIVELVAKSDYMKYTQDHIFKPLGLDDISWTIEGYTKEQQANIVYPYMFNITAAEIQPYIPEVPITQLSDNWVSLELNSIQPYPAGQLRSTIQSLSVLLSMFINNGTYKNIQILQPKSVHEISTVQYPNVTRSSVGLVYTYFKSAGFPFDKDYLVTMVL
jgi:CubicO group peptidase (beta-lactamase class C family)